MKRWILLGIFLLALFLRVVNLSKYPVGFTPDEASFGYDAYSILRTGKDQWGHSFPLVLESFGDFKPPLYAYILIPFVSAFGLSEWVVRLPNALLGSLSVFATFYLVQELFKKGKGKDLISLVASFLVATSSWHVMLSRGGFEANLTTFMLPLGILLFLKGLENNLYLRLSALVFGLNMFSYHSARLVTPLIAGLLFLLYINRLKAVSERKITLKKYGMYIGILFFFVGLNAYTFKLGAGTRAKDVSVLSGAMEAAAAPRLEAINKGVNPTIAKLLNNQFTVATKRFSNNYIQYFSQKFLLTSGPGEATYGMIPGRGVLYWYEFIFFVFGIFLLLRRHWRKKGETLEEKNFMNIMSVWLLLAPIPAALATGAGFAGNRSAIMIPAVQIVAAWGFFVIYRHLSSKMNVGIVAVGLSILSLVSIYKFGNEYFTTTRMRFASSMLYGRKEMVDYLLQKDYLPTNKIVVIDKRLSEPHMYVAFYMQIDPKQYQEWSKGLQAYRGNVGFVDQMDEYSLGKYFFTTNFQEKPELLNSDYVLAGKPEEFGEIVPDHIVKYPDGTDAIYVTSLQKEGFALNNN